MAILRRGKSRTIVPNAESPNPIQPPMGKSEALAPSAADARCMRGSGTNPAKGRSILGHRLLQALFDRLSLFQPQEVRAVWLSNFHTVSWPT